MNNSMQDIYTQLWNEHVQSVRNYCYSKLKGRPEDAEDMLQDAFGLLWKKIITDDVPPEPKRWLFKTVKNLACAEYRHTAKAREKLSSAPFDEALYTHNSVEDVAQTLEKEEHNAQMWKAFDEELTTEEKKIIIYDTVKEIPQAEIAKIINKNPSTTRVNIHRAKLKLGHIKQKIEKN